MMNWMTETYHKNSASDEYWFGFILSGLLYVVCGMTFEDLSKYFRMDRASSAKGGFLKIRIRATSSELKDLLPKAVLLGSADLLMDDRYNRGEMFEKIITERYTNEEWVKDSVPFFAAPDAVIEGRRVQIKLNQAELTNEKILRRYGLT